jgi:hypothetical protein
MMDWLDLSQRLDLGLGNPNRTGAWLCLVMMASWLPAFWWKKAFWFSWAANLALGFLLLWTASRGSLVACVAGYVVLMPFVMREHWSRPRLMALALGFVLLLLCGAGGGMSERVVSVPRDRSVSNRLVIWEKALRMIVDAPDGWGTGRAADAYHQWYQEIGSDLTYKNLVNSHLTWLVEFGGAGRFFYLLGWGLVFWLCWPSCRFPWTSVPMAAWTVFFVAAIFSAVADNTAIWTVPMVLLAAVIGWRMKTSRWPNPVWGVLPLLFAGSAMAALPWLGNSTRQEPVISKKGSLIQIGDGSPQIIWVEPRPVIMGAKYGHALRKHSLAGNPHAILVCQEEEQLGRLPEAKVLVFAGELGHAGQWEDFLSAEGKDVVLINPIVSEGWIPDPMKIRSKLTVVWGELRERPGREYWQRMAKENPRVRFQVVPAAGEYIPQWDRLGFLADFDSK